MDADTTVFYSEIKEKTGVGASYSDMKYQASQVETRFKKSAEIAV
jgi:hypothetical protein